MIKQGSRGPLVREWQEFLRGLELYMGVVDGIFGPQLHAGTCRYQELHRLIADGIVGNQTWGRAMVDGFEVVKPAGSGKETPNWPPIPKGLKQANLATRYKLFGKFNYKPAPAASNPEGIKILGGWTKDHITRVTIPQLKGVTGAPKSGRIFWHKAAADQIVGLFQAWEDAGLIHLVRAWAGSWNPRFIRGSRSVLSNHSWATAFDINVPGNGLRRQPALVGQPWSVRELVPLANKWGFWWGGHWGYNGGRYDGMHFEVAKLV